MSGWMDMDLIRLKVVLIKPDRLLCANNGHSTILAGARCKERPLPKLVIHFLP